MGVSEVVCRAISVVLSMVLLQRLQWSGFGRIEFSFQIVFWLVLIVRDCFETIITREIARHPRITRNLVNHVLAVKLTFAIGILAALAMTAQLAFSEVTDRWVLILYGLLLLTTALGLDFVYRGKETMGLVAVSLLVRTSVYCIGVWYCVHDSRQILMVPLWLACGEFTGIALVWAVYARQFGFPRPVLRGRFLLVFLKRGRLVGLIHLCQAVLISADLLVVGLMNSWSDVGRYGGAQRIISTVMAFGMIVQQVVFPSLSRSWRASSESTRRLLDFAVRILVSGFIPVAVGGSLLAEPLVRFLLPPQEYHEAGLLLAIGIWKAPLLSLAFLYQSSLIAMNRESQGLKLLAWGSLCSGPMIALMHWRLGLPGASLAVLVIGLGLVIAGYCCLAVGPCRPSAHHHLARPLFASLVMSLICVLGLRIHVVVAVVAGAVSYLITMKLIGGLDFRPMGADDAG